MTKTAIFDKIRTALSDSLDIDPETVTLETHIINDLHADSISIMEFTLGLEDEFGIEISDEDAETILTIDDVVNYIATRI